MNKYIKIFLFLLALLQPVSAYSFTFYSSGIYYNITDFNTVEVTYLRFGEPTRTYYGDLVIPSSTNWGSQVYTVTAIGESAFLNCTELQSIVIPNTVTSIGTDAFFNCYNMFSIDFGNHVENIGYEAFCNCMSLCNVTLPNSLITIDKYAFRECNFIKSIDIPNSVTSIGDYAFYNCMQLKSVTIGNSVISIGKGAFQKCESLNNIDISNSVVSIGADAFKGCNIYRVTIPNSVTTIGDYAFDCVKTAIIGNSVSYIGKGAFQSVTNYFTCLAKIPPQASDQSFMNYSTTTVCVPATSYNAYRTTSPWKKFNYIDRIKSPFDVNKDYEVNIADINAVINIIMTGGLDNSADVNEDGEVNIADVNAIINEILSN